MYEVRTCSSKICRKLEQNLKAADILATLSCEATCETNTCVHINHMGEAKCKTEHLPAAGNNCILVQEETEKWTAYMERNPSSEANNSSASQEISHIL